MSDQSMAAMEFHMGDNVEVVVKEKEHWVSYYSATVVSEEGDSLYWVQYHTLLTDDETGFLRELVAAAGLRPSPPQMPVARFSPLDRVDASDHHRLSVGRVTGKTRAGYYVFFATTWDEIAYPLSRLRPHLDWTDDGKWVRSERRV